MSELGGKKTESEIDVEEYKQKPSSAVSDYDRFVQAMKKEESYDRKIKLLQIVNNMTIISDSVPESIPSGLLSVLDDCMRNTQKRQTMILTDYREWTNEKNYRSLKSNLDDAYGLDVNINQVSEMNKYVVEDNNNNMICELFIGSDSVYISDYHYINSFIINDEDRELANAALRGLVKCCSKGSIPSLRAVDWGLFLLTEFPSSQMSRLSSSLIEQIAIQNTEKIVNCQTRIFDVLIESHQEGNKRAFKSVYKIANQIHPEVNDEDRIASYLKDNIVEELHGGDRKMCRSAISNLTGEHRLKLYYKEITGKI